MNAQLYRTRLKAIAENHKAIEATDNNGRFIEIVEAYDPRTMDLTQEFKNSLSSKLKLEDKYALCLVSLAAAYTDTINQNKHLVGLGAFVVFKKQAISNMVLVATALDEARELGEQILAYLRQQDYLYMNGYSTEEPLKVDWNDTNFFPFVHNTNGGLVGARFEFKTETPHNVKMNYNPVYWNTPLPEG